MAPDDRVLLTGRDPERVHAATAAIAGGQSIARVEGHVLDVRDGDAIASLAGELAEVYIVFSNAASRMSPDVDLPTKSTPPPRPTTSRRPPCCASSPRACPARAAGRRPGSTTTTSAMSGRSRPARTGAHERGPLRSARAAVRPKRTTAAAAG
jgi:hypothetical protein